MKPQKAYELSETDAAVPDSFEVPRRKKNGIGHQVDHMNVSEWESNSQTSWCEKLGGRKKKRYRKAEKRTEDKALFECGEGQKTGNRGVRLKRGILSRVKGE